MEALVLLLDESVCGFDCVSFVFSVNCNINVM